MSTHPMPPEAAAASQTRPRLPRTLRRAAVNLSLMACSLCVSLCALEWVLARFFTPTLLIQQDPYVGWTHIPGMSGYDVSPGEYRIEYTINSHGLRDDEYEYAKSPGAFRILVLGDSFTEATYVRLEEAYHSVLEAGLDEAYRSPVEVINAGVRGYGTANELLYFTQEGYRYQPDIVLVGFFIGNDFDDNTYEFSDTLKLGHAPYYTLDPEGNLVLNNYPAPAPDPGNEPTDIGARLKQFRLTGVVGDVLVSWPPTLRWGARWNIFRPPPNDYRFAPPEERSDSMDASWDLALALIRALRDEVEARDARLVFILIPAGFQVYQSTWDFRTEIFPATADWDPALANRELGAFLDEEGIPYLDMQPILYEYAETHDEPLYYARDRGHWTPLAHRLAGEALEQFLREEGLLDALEP